MQTIKAVIILVILTLVIACAGGPAKRTAELVARDYQTMNDAELQSYYAQLSDQLARETRAARMERGSIVGSGRGEENLAALRTRWNEVRGEMRQRELLPPP